MKHFLFMIAAVALTGLNTGCQKLTFSDSDAEGNSTNTHFETSQVSQTFALALDYLAVRNHLTAIFGAHNDINTRVTAEVFGGVCDRMASTTLAPNSNGVIVTTSTCNGSSENSTALLSATRWTTLRGVCQSLTSNATNRANAITYITGSATTPAPLDAASIGNVVQAFCSQTPCADVGIDSLVALAAQASTTFANDPQKNSKTWEVVLHSMCISPSWNLL